MVDLDGIGLTGIGCYLCWRLEKNGGTARKSLSSKLSTSLVSCVDWIEAFISEKGSMAFTATFEPKPFCWLLERLRGMECCREAASRVTHLFHSLGPEVSNVRTGELCAMEIEKMAMGIYNADF